MSGWKVTLDDWADSNISRIFMGEGPDGWGNYVVYKDGTIKKQKKGEK